MLTSEYVNYLQGMIMSNYILGKEDPEYIIDAGSGEWCGAGHFSEQLYHYKCYLEQLVEGSFYLKYRYPVARDHLLHYLQNTGEDVHINLFDLMSKSNQLRDNYVSELNEAKVFCRNLSPGQHFFTSESVSTDDFISSDPDLFYAIGGYQYWGKGQVLITEDKYKNTMSNGSRLCSYDLTFQFKFFDSYNWNVTVANSEVRLGSVIPVSDDFMGRFHQECLAREYNIFGTIESEVKWHD